jgi:uncharacterized membrane protein (UPF0127 family)
MGLLALWSAGPVRADVDAPEPLSAFPRIRLDIRRADTGRVIHIDSWVADRPSRQEQGLMFIRELAEHQGMLFVFSSVQRINMWMKNTYISLDMVFIGDDGRIQIIAPRTVPLSLDLIAPPQPARAVLELKGGACAALGIHAGDRLVNLNFPPAQ